ncbi:MAG: peptidoglycan bridge formation glycyltransferase FemA/FemB family protein [Parcubacteria group bacterium]|nr:peptidoglycan bridge formation glycyltransferase FemA/FemB family protein [Parcubacteria group bacterium]
MTSAIRVAPIEKREVWEAFAMAQALPQFMQSWEAGELAQNMGEEILRLGVFDGDALVGTCLLTLVRAKRGTYLFAPYGPIFSAWRPEYLSALTESLNQHGKRLKADFIRLAPFLERTPDHLVLLAQAGFRVAPIHMLAEHLWLLDLAGKDEATLLAGMSKTTRYSIKRAAKDGVHVASSATTTDLDTFLTLHAATKERHHFTPYPDKMFIKQVERFAPVDEVRLFTASHNGQALASALVMYYGSMASYHHGASIPSKIPAAYALQWAAILEAKQRGCTVYNFWGVTDLQKTSHPFYGISLFKTRFGGRPFELVPCHDLALTAKYRLTWLVETVRRIRRGFGLRRR